MSVANPKPNKKVTTLAKQVRAASRPAKTTGDPGAATREALQVDKCLNKVTRKRIDIRPIQRYLVSGLRGPKYTNGRKHKRYKC